MVEAVRWTAGRPSARGSTATDGDIAGVQPLAAHRASAFAMNLVKLDRERPMLRSSLTLLIAAAAAGLATGNVQAGGCADPCGPGVVAVVAAPTPAPAPFYIVDQGPVYY